MRAIKKIKPNEFQTEVLDCEGPVAVVYWNRLDPNHAHYATQLAMQSEATPDIKVVTIDVSEGHVRQWAAHQQNVIALPALFIYKSENEKAEYPRHPQRQAAGRDFVSALRRLFE